MTSFQKRIFFHYKNYRVSFINIHIWNKTRTWAINPTSERAQPSIHTTKTNLMGCVNMITYKEYLNICVYVHYWSSITSLTKRKIDALSKLKIICVLYMRSQHKHKRLQDIHLFSLLISPITLLIASNCLTVASEMSLCSSYLTCFN